MQESELQALLDESPSSDSDDEEVPIRMLKDFTIFRRANREMVVAEALRELDEDSPSIYAVTGSVDSYIGGDPVPTGLEEDVSMNLTNVTLTELKALNVHDWPEDGELNRYVR